MAYEKTGLQALFPIYLARTERQQEDADARDSAIAQNENNLNQNLEILFSKLAELEDAISELS